MRQYYFFSLCWWKKSDVLEEVVDLCGRSYFDDVSDVRRNGFWAKNPGGIWSEGACSKDDFIFTPSGELDDSDAWGWLDNDDGGGGVRNKGSVVRLLKFKLSLQSGSFDVDAVVNETPAAAFAVAATDAGSDGAMLPVVLVVVVEVLPHNEDNTKAAATVCSWL